MNREKKLLKNTVIFAIGNFSSKLLTFLLLPIYTRILTTGEFGYYDLIVTFVTLLVPIISFQVQEGAYRFILDNNINDKEKIISTSFFLVLRNLVLSNVIFICSLYFIDIKYAVFILIYYNLYVISEMYLQITRGLQLNAIYAKAGIINTFTTLCFTVIFLVFLNYKIEGILLSILFGFFLSIVYLESKTRIIKNIRIKYIDSVLKKQLLLYSLPLIPNILNWWIMNVSDRLLIKYYLGSSANGIYAIANKFPSMLIIISSIFYLAWQESAIKEANSKDRDIFYTRMFNGFFKFQFSSLFVLLSSSYILVNILVNDDFKSAYLYMPFLFLGAIFSSFSSFYGTGFQSSKETKGAFYSSVAGSILNIIFNIILIPKIGLMGASLATMIAFFIMWIMRIYQTKKYFNIKLDYKSISICSLLTIVFITLYYVNYSYGYRISIILLSLVIAFLLNRKLIGNIVGTKIKSNKHVSYKE